MLESEQALMKPERPGVAYRFLMDPHSQSIILRLTSQQEIRMKTEV